MLNPFSPQAVDIRWPSWPGWRGSVVIKNCGQVRSAEDEQRSRDRFRRSRSRSTSRSRRPRKLSDRVLSWKWEHESASVEKCPRIGEKRIGKACRQILAVKEEWVGMKVLFFLDVFRCFTSWCYIFLQLLKKRFPVTSPFGRWESLRSVPNFAPRIDSYDKLRQLHEGVGGTKIAQQLSLW